MWKVLISNNSTGSLGEYLYQGCSSVEVCPFKCFVFKILAYKFDNLSVDWWIYVFNIPWSRCCSSAQPKETSYPYVGVGPRKDENHNGNNQCSEVLTLYQKNPLSTNKPPCLNIYFKMKIKLKAFVLNAQIPLPFLNPLSWKTPLDFLTKPSIVI